MLAIKAIRLQFKRNNTYIQWRTFNVSNSPRVLIQAIIVNQLNDLNQYWFGGPLNCCLKERISPCVRCVLQKCLYGYSIRGGHTHQLSLLHFKPARDARKTLHQSQGRPLHPQALHTHTMNL